MFVYYTTKLVYGTLVYLNIIQPNPLGILVYYVTKEYLYIIQPNAFGIFL